MLPRNKAHDWWSSPPSVLRSGPILFNPTTGSNKEPNENSRIWYSICCAARFPPSIHPSHTSYFPAPLLHVLLQNGNFWFISRGRESCGEVCVVQVQVKMSKFFRWRQNFGTQYVLFSQWLLIRPGLFTHPSCALEILCTNDDRCYVSVLKTQLLSPNRLRIDLSTSPCVFPAFVPKRWGTHAVDVNSKKEKERQGTWLRWRWFIRQLPRFSAGSHQVHTHLHSRHRWHDT